MEGSLRESEQRFDLKTWNSDVRDELKEAFTKPLYNMADRIEAFVEERPEVVNEVAHWRSADEVPYSVHDLPPHLYEHCGNPTPFIPQSEHELERFMDSYWEYNLRLHASMPGFHAHATFPEQRSNLTIALRQRMETGKGVDLDDWTMYQASYEAQKARGFFTLGHNSAVMNIPWITGNAAIRGIFDYASGRQRSYLLSSVSSPHRIGLYLRVPVGGYGPEFAERLTRTASFMYDFIEQDPELHADLWRQFHSHADTVGEHTTRGVLNKTNYSSEESMIVTAQEGVGSVVGAVNLGTAEVLDNYPDPDSALAAVIEGDFPNKMGNLFPVGVVGSASIFGTFFPGMVLDNGGRLAFNPKSLADLQEITERATALMHKQWSDYRARVEANGGEIPADLMPPNQTGLTCPAAGSYVSPEGAISPGAISRLSRTFLKVYSCIEVQPNHPAIQGLPWGVSKFLLDRA